MNIDHFLPQNDLPCNGRISYSFQVLFLPPPLRTQERRERKVRSGALRRRGGGELKRGVHPTTAECRGAPPSPPEATGAVVAGARFNRLNLSIRKSVAFSIQFSHLDFMYTIIVLGDRIGGCHRNRENVSCSRAETSRAIKSAVAKFPSYSGAKLSPFALNKS